MLKSYSFILLALVALFCFIFQTDAQQRLEAVNQPVVEYELVWQEDFNGKTLDTESWSIIDRLSPEWCKYMSANPSLYKLSNGKMRLYAKRNNGIEPLDTARYLTAGISTQHKRTFTYGKIEVRAKIKGAQGCWPAIWIKNDNPRHWGYPERAEIDIIEYYNKEDIVHCTAHCNYTDILKNTKSPQSEATAKIKKNKYNTYAIEILPDRLVWSVNGEPVLTYPNINKPELAQYPFGAECYLMLDMQVGNPWLRDIREKDFPAYMDIDWVKIYKIANHDE